MIEFLSSWAQGIIVAVIIATLIEMILPNSSSKKICESCNWNVHIVYNSISNNQKKIGWQRY